jgi:hypothetical protein
VNNIIINSRFLSEYLVDLCTVYFLQFEGNLLLMELQPGVLAPHLITWIQSDQIWNVGLELSCYVHVVHRLSFC